MFFFRESKLCAPEKSGAPQIFSAPELYRSAPGTRFVQAYNNINNSNNDNNNNNNNNNIHLFI